MIWDSLSNSNLQKLIGDPLLSNLEETLPLIIENDVLEPFDINRRNILKKIVSAFINKSFFKNEDNIIKLLNILSEEEIDRCIDAINPSYKNCSFIEKIKLIASKWNSLEFNSKIIRWAELPDEFLIRKEKKENSSITLQVPESPYKTLKDYQIPVFLEAQKELENLNSKFVIQMPTGSGKTRTAMEIVTDYINNASENMVVVWLAHSEELCDQALACFIEVWKHVGRKELTAYRCLGTDPVPKKVNKNAFIVAGFSKFNAALKKENAFAGFSENVGLIIVDEAHKVIAPTYKKVTKALINGKKGTRVIGLTATPGRHILDDEGNRALSEFFFNRCLTINLPKGENNVISYLRDKRVLSKVNISPIKGVNIVLNAQEKRDLERNFDFPPGFLERLGADNIRNIEILKRLQIEAKEGHQILFFACSVKHSKFICSMLLYLGFKAAHIDGETDKETRQAVLEKFKRGEINIICNFGVLSTGFDAPKTDVVCIARPTQSIVLYSQMIGRGLRGPAIGGTENCKLLNVKDNIKNLPNYTNIFGYFDDYWTEE